jgi:hypothetical protein
MNDTLSPYAPPAEQLSPYAPPTEQRSPVDLDIDAARQAFRGPAPGYKLVLAGTAVFAVSLALPAITVRIFTSSDMPGIAALVWCFLIAIEKPISIMPLIVLSNLWLVVLPFAARSRNPDTLVKVAGASWLALVPPVLLLVLAGFDTKDLLPGYYAWVLAFVLGALGATRAASQARRRRALEETA